ncbi:ParA family protein [Kitasatospora sp. NPDC088548]|uniref:ParA family protein n=1 Tax=Kitasatospora sp. NPDC088548 TaxID=3364075 RepID=UPI00382B208E
MRETQEKVQVTSLGDDLAFLDITTEWDLTSSWQDWKPGITVPDSFRPSTLPRVIAVCNQKGGAGKTTTTLELAMALIARGLRVRIIDADDQAASISVWLRYFLDDRPEELRYNLRDLYFDAKVKLSDAAYRTPFDNLAFIPSFPDLGDVDEKNPIGADSCLQRRLRLGNDDVDVTIIDCGPRLGTLTVSALVAAHDVIIPVNASSGLDIHGVGALQRVIATVQETLNPELRVAAAVLTDFSRSKLARKIGGSLSRAYPDAVILPARTNVKVGEAQLAKQPLRQFAPGQTTTMDYDMGARVLFGLGAAA